MYDYLNTISRTLIVANTSWICTRGR